MNIQKSLYRCLLRLGVNMIEPQGYICSRAHGHPDLVFSFLNWEGEGVYVLLANYSIHNDRAVPEPEVVIHITSQEKRATVFTCEWPNDKEVASTALDHRTFAWLDWQICHGHHFLGQQKMPGNVVAFHSKRRARYDDPL